MKINKRFVSHRGLSWRIHSHHAIPNVSYRHRCV